MTHETLQSQMAAAESELTERLQRFIDRWNAGQDPANHIYQSDDIFFASLTFQAAEAGCDDAGSSCTVGFGQQLTGSGRTLDEAVDNACFNYQVAAIRSNPARAAELFREAWK